MQIKFRKTHPAAVIPKRGSAWAAGFDLTAVSLRRAGDLYIYDTGIALEIPPGYFGGIYARSSLFFTGLEKVGGVCVIDSDYRGSIFVIFREIPGDYTARRLSLHSLYPGKTHMMMPYKEGDRIAQLIIQSCLPLAGVGFDAVEFVEVDELSETVRGTGAYGSTGR